jgi:hypothetical protein
MTEHWKAKNPEEWKRNLSQSHKGKYDGKKNPFYNKHHTEQTKKKLSKMFKGKHHSLNTEFKIGQNLGKKLSKEHIKKISEAKKGEKNPMFGKPSPTIGKHLFEMEKNPMWKGGKSFEIYGIEFNKELKTNIRKRDNFSCRICSKNGFITHHIDYNKKNNKPENLITLCRNCHAKTNHNNRESWINYFNKLQK